MRTISQENFLSPKEMLRMAVETYFSVQYVNGLDEWGILYEGTPCDLGYDTEEEAWQRATRYFLTSCGFTITEAEL